jgi:Family of unknown function (DUF5706)
MSQLIIVMIAALGWRRRRVRRRSHVGMDDEVLTYAAAVLAAAREELGLADHKAEVLVAGTGVAVGALVAGLLAGNWSPFELANGVEWLWWVGVVCSAGAIACLGSSLYPRTRRRGDSSGIVAYYADVLAYPATNDLVAALHRSASSGTGSMADQLRQVSRIVACKYRLIQVALWLLTAAVLCCTTAVLINLRLG